MAKSDVASRSKYLSVLTDPGAAFATLDEQTFSALANEPNCFEVRKELLKHSILEAAAVMTQVRPAHVQISGQDFLTSVAPDKYRQRDVIHLAGAPRALTSDDLSRPALVSFVLFGSSYCFAGEVVSRNGSSLLLTQPQSLFLRRRRRHDRLILTNPLAGRLIYERGAIDVGIRDIGEGGAGLSFPAEVAVPEDILALELKLPTGPLRRGVSPCWTHRVANQWFLGVAFLPDEDHLPLTTLDRRASWRHELSTPIECEVEGPGTLPTSGEVLDLSLDGAKIRVAGGRFRQNTPISLLKVTLDDAKVSVSGGVAWVDEEEGKQTLGLEFAKGEPGSRDELLSFLRRQMRPNVGEVEPDELEQVLDLYKEVNYFGETGKGSKVREVLEGARKTWATLAKTGQELGTLVCVREGHKIAGISGIHRVYRATWLSHSMAAVRGRSLIPTEHLRLGHVEQMERQPTAKYILAFFLKDKGYSKRYYRSAVAASPRPDLHHLFIVDVVDFALPAALPSARPEASLVGPASPDEERQFLAMAKERFPEVYLGAVDLLDGGVTLGSVANEYAAAGLERDRFLLVQRSDGQPVAYALVEISSPGLSLNGCTDGFWMYPAAPDGQLDASAVQPLIEACLWEFHDRGRTRCNFFSQLDDNAPLLGEHASLIPDLCIWSCTVEAAADVRKFWQHAYGTYKLKRLGYLREPSLTK